MNSSRGPKPKFTAEEDAELIQIVQKQGSKGWAKIAKKLKTKSAKQCRERWTNYLNPTLSFEAWTKEDDDLLVDKFQEFGTQWRILRSYFPNRSVNNIRNRVIQLKKRIKQRGDKRVSKAGRTKKIQIKKKVETVMKIEEKEEKIEENDQFQFVNKIFKVMDEKFQPFDWFIKGEQSDFVDLLCVTL